MSLIDTMKTGCTMLDKRTVNDGQGGVTTLWVDGATFQAAIIKDESMQARLAEKQGVTELYTVTVDRSLMLEYHDAFRRNSDGAVFRVTSNVVDSKTPTVASFAFGQVTAERWVLPT